MDCENGVIINNYTEIQMTEIEKETLAKVKKALATLQYWYESGLTEVIGFNSYQEIYEGLRAAEDNMNNVMQKEATVVSFPTPNFDGVSENVIEDMVNDGTPSHEALELFDETARPETGIAVDCGTLDGNNPGLFEYRIVDIASGKTLKRVKIPGKTTNNIAEFLALVDGIVWCCELKIQGAVYSDSKNALAWVKKGACRTKFNVTNWDQKDMITEAEDQLILTSYHNAGVKTFFWSNKRFGETPADLSGSKGVTKKDKLGCAICGTPTFGKYCGKHS